MVIKKFSLILLIFVTQEACANIKCVNISLLNGGPYECSRLSPLIHTVTITRRSRMLREFDKDGFKYQAFNYAPGLVVKDIQTQKIVGTLNRTFDLRIAFGDTHILFNGVNVRPYLRSKAFFSKFVSKTNTEDVVRYATDLKALNPSLFIVPQVLQTAPSWKEGINFIEQMPTSVLAQILQTESTPQGVLNVLLIMKNPQKFLSDSSGLDLLAQLYTDLFQFIWFERKAEARRMILSFLKLKDPLISSLVNGTPYMSS